MYLVERKGDTFQRHTCRPGDSAVQPVPGKFLRFRQHGAGSGAASHGYYSCHRRRHLCHAALRDTSGAAFRGIPSGKIYCCRRPGTSAGTGRNVFQLSGSSMITRNCVFKIPAWRTPATSCQPLREEKIGALAERHARTARQRVCGKRRRLSWGRSRMQPEASCQGYARRLSVTGILRDFSSLMLFCPRAGTGVSCQFLAGNRTLTHNALMFFPDRLPMRLYPEKP